MGSIRHVLVKLLYPPEFRRGKISPPHLTWYSGRPLVSRGKQADSPGIFRYRKLLPDGGKYKYIFICKEG
jgi:hypothetical protein